MELLSTTAKCVAFFYYSWSMRADCRGGRIEIIQDNEEEK